ncbi:MAG: pseudaminic acid cytidylyltransferase [bacterium]
MNIAVIPARGGSKRIPRKNIRYFAGKPMLAHAICTAKSSGLFDRIVVSTDDEEIARIAVEYGASVPFERPAELAGDHTPTVPVISHAIRACQGLGWKIDYVCCIYPTVPFLQSVDLVTALSMMEANTGDYVFPVANFPSAIQRALRQLPNGLMEPFYSQFTTTRTQDFEPAYYDAGQFYWGHVQTWVKEIDIHKHGAGLVVPGWRVVDIDTAEDWERAELMYATLMDSKQSA